MVDMRLHIALPSDDIDFRFIEREANTSFFSIQNKSGIQRAIDPSDSNFLEALLITYQGKSVSDFRFCDVRLLTQLIAVVEDYYLSAKKTISEDIYGLGVITIGLRQTGENKLLLTAVKDGNTIVQAELPEKEWIDKLFALCREYFSCLIQYGIAESFHTKQLSVICEYEKRYKDTYRKNLG
ncbi:hypothetical protein [Brevibacillus sp. 1238]|uniref:hypothetical protein n=1 Tax=Brevibacillus sp. 1238 TaxID=2940565 RepID=UPI002472EFE8|nr:hypothetical protein [Brevibacillus sp. 1238]MDH6351638.1 hypothetical protein [Brevibacillus sp. 1238]